ncbi:MAG: 16S rRNA (guanine(966)-N(2))-methyltransferase RsmD [Actinobacteria bacterium]|nr:MAG: 16S rRNA (guanine(966)-N(2))-methyltransferase RsmD [Actinomycetota bacterium]
MRVIAGVAKGTKLKAPKGLTTRPTADRVKEAVFSMIKESLEFSMVLDLFAGAGAIGIEALSRGSDKAVFVEKDKVACRYIEENLKKTSFTGKAEIVKTDVFSFLKSNQELKYNLIFADPPYRIEKNLLDKLVILALALLKNDGLLVIEHSRGQPLNNEIANIIKTKKYAGTAISIIKKDL